MTGAETVVVKVGGGDGAVDPARLCADVAALTAGGTRVVLVHGGSDEMARLAADLGVGLRELAAPDGVTTRYTDAATLDVLTLALAGRVKPALVAGLARRGVPAVGLTGLNAGLLRARRKRAVRAVVEGRTMIVRDDLSGRIVAVNATLLTTLLGSGLVPVLSPPALDENAEPVNVNADRVAAAVAGALEAQWLVFLTAAAGVRDAAGRVLPRYRVSPAGRDPVVTGGMTIKLVAAAEARAAGVPHVAVGDGHAERPVSAIFAGGTGTVVD